MRPFIVRIPGKPIPQERPFVTRHGTFDRPRSKAEKNRIGFLLAAAKIAQKWQIAEGPVSVELFFYGCNPAADIDNLQKLVMDAAKGILWVDDRQVVGIRACKYPSHKDKATEITVEVVE